MKIENPQFLSLAVPLVAKVLMPSIPLAAAPVFAGDRTTASEAEALVKKAAAHPEANGEEKAFAEVNNANRQFRNKNL